MMRISFARGLCSCCRCLGFFAYVQCVCCCGSTSKVGLRGFTQQPESSQELYTSGLSVEWATEYFYFFFSLRFAVKPTLQTALPVVSPTFSLIQNGI